VFIEAGDRVCISEWGHDEIFTFVVVSVLEGLAVLKAVDPRVRDQDRMHVTSLRKVAAEHESGPDGKMPVGGWELREKDLK